MSTENAKKDDTTSEVPKTTESTEPSPYIYSGQKLQKHSIFTKTAEDLPYFQINKRAQELDINKVPRKWVVSYPDRKIFFLVKHSNLLHFQIRNCDVYREEYQACKSIKGRLHQYYGNILQNFCII